MIAGPAPPRLRATLSEPRWIGVVGILLGVLAFLLAVPPLTARAPFWPGIVGILGVAAGIWSVNRGAGKVGWGAVAVGLIGIGLGYLFRLGVLDVQTSQIGFIGIAVALLGRNTAVGVLFSSLLFGALLYGTSTRSLDPEVFPPELAGNLTLMIQALVLLFIGADVLVIFVWRKLRRSRRHEAGP